MLAGGCGPSGEKFSGAEADRALAQLDAIQQLVDQGRCTAAQRRVNILVAQAANINQNRADLGAAWAKSTQRLQQLVTRECVEVKATQPTGGGTASTGATGEPTGTTQATPEPTPAPPQTGGGVAPNGGGNGGNNGQGNGNNGNGGGGDNSGGVSPK